MAKRGNIQLNNAQTNRTRHFLTRSSSRKKFPISEFFNCTIKIVPNESEANHYKFFSSKSEFEAWDLSFENLGLQD